MTIRYTEDNKIAKSGLCTIHNVVYCIILARTYNAQLKSPGFKQSRVEFGKTTAFIPFKS